MPIIKSAKKRVRVARKAAIRNSKTRRSLKTSLKTFSAKPTADGHSSAYSNLDKAVKKGVIHKNKAARLKKRAAAQAKAAGVKPAKSAKATAKPAIKKAPANTAKAAKPAAKKK
jgi:small subunit ribosomal protein S20